MIISPASTAPRACETPTSLPAPLRARLSASSGRRRSHVALDVQAVLAQTYDAGSYPTDRLHRPCELPLNPDDRAWRITSEWRR